MSNGEIWHLPSYNLSTTSPPPYSFRIERIQIHIQFTDRSYNLIQSTVKQSNDRRKYIAFKKKIFGKISSKRDKHRLNGKQIENGHLLPKKKKNNHHTYGKKSKISSKKSKPSFPSQSIHSLLNLPDLEPKTTKAISEDSVSSMSITPEIEHKELKQDKKRKRNASSTKHLERPNKKRKLNNENG